LLFVFCLPTTPHEWLYIVYLVASSIIGGIVGYLVMKLEKVGVALGGGLLGFFVSTFLWAILLGRFSLPNIAFYGLVFVLIVIGVLLTWVLHDQILILSTSFCGAYGVIRAASLIFGGYPNEFTMAKEIEDGTFKTVYYFI
jgi:hypothetical protein